ATNQGRILFESSLHIKWDFVSTWGDAYGDSTSLGVYENDGDPNEKLTRLYLHPASGQSDMKLIFPTGTNPQAAGSITIDLGYDSVEYQCKVDRFDQTAFDKVIADTKAAAAQNVVLALCPGSCVPGLGCDVRAISAQPAVERTGAVFFASYVPATLE